MFCEDWRKSVQRKLSRKCLNIITNMGSEESKTQMNHQSDAEVTIINNQNEHAEKLENHAFILWVILAIVATQLAITLVGIVKRYVSRKTMKKAEALT